MAHFAELDVNNVVLQVIVVNNSVLLDANGVEQESIGQAFCTNLLGGRWMQTSYNGTFRKNFATIGGKYDAGLDAFISISPYPSWLLNLNTCQWESPVPYPATGIYVWNEATQTWDGLTPS